VAPREWWQVLAQRRARWWAARPALAARWAKIRALGLWVALVWVLGLLVLVPDVRLSVRAWLGCVWVVVAWYFLARTKTLTWSGYMRFFTACIPWSFAIGLISTWLATTVLDTYVRGTGPSMAIASITEETLKLVPVALVALLAPRRASRFAAMDWLLLGLASGTAFLLAEEALRRITLSDGAGLAGLLDRVLSGGRVPSDWITFRGWPVPTGWDQGGRGFGGHGVVTAIVAGLVGLAIVAVRHVRGRTDRGAHVVRAGAVLVPFVALLVAIADHAAYNGGGGGWHEDGPPYWLDPATTNVPWWIRAPWSLFGHGHFRPTVFVLLAVVVLLVDGSRLARVPAAGLVPTARPRWIDGAAAGLAGVTSSWPRALRDVPASLTFAVLGTGWVLARDWRTGLLGFTKSAEQSRREAAQQGATLLAGQRAVRELGYDQLVGPVDVRTRRRLAAGTLVLLLLGGLVLAPVTAAGLSSVYEYPSWLAGVMNAVGSWWDGLSPGAKIAVGIGAGALLALTPLGLGGAFFVTGALTWGLDHRKGIGTFLDDPRSATKGYLATTTPAEAVADVGMFALTFWPGGIGAAGGTLAKPALQELAWALRHHPQDFLDSAAARIRWNLRHPDDTGAVQVVSARRPGDPASVGWATSKDYRATFARANPTIDMSTIVVHHAVERDVLRRFPGLFDEFELHSIENLRGIPRTVNSSVHLSAIRKEWNVFYRRFEAGGTMPPRQDVLNEATRIDDMLGHLFTPKER